MYKGRYEVDKEKQKEYYEKEIEYAKQIIKKYPNDYNALVSYGVIAGAYQIINNQVSAIFWFKKAIEKYSEKGKKEEVAFLISGLISSYYLNKEYNKGLIQAERLLNEFSNTQTIRATKGLIYGMIGDIYWQLGNFDKTIEYYKLALEEKTGIFDLGETCFLIAEIYEYDKKDIEKAKLWYQKVISEYPNSEYFYKAQEKLKELEK
jgi:tetratricopeptide (TPR) repeat protein